MKEAGVLNEEEYIDQKTNMLYVLYPTVFQIINNMILIVTAYTLYHGIKQT